MTLDRQTRWLTWLVLMGLLAITLMTTLVMRDVGARTAQIQTAEYAAHGVTHFRYLIMEAAIFHDPRTRQQWNEHLHSFRTALASFRYQEAKKNAMLARQLQRVDVMARQFQRLADAAQAPEAGGEPTRQRSLLVSNLFSSTQTMLDDAFALMRMNRADLQHAENLALAVVVGDVCLLSILLLASVAVIRLRVMRPVAALQAMAERVTEGALDARVGGLEANELGTLARTFDRMTERLEQSHSLLIAENARRRRTQAELEALLDENLRNRAELARSQEDLQNIIDHTPALVVYWDKNLINRFANRACQQWFGVAPEAMRGKHIADIIGPRRFASFEALLQLVLQGEPQLFERTIRTDDGQERQALFSFIPESVDGVVQGFYGFVSDISQLRLAQAGQAQALAQLRSVVDAATDFAIIATSLDGTIEVFSAGAERLLGYAATELVHLASPACFHLPSEVEARSRALTAQCGRPVAGFDVFVEQIRQGGSESREWTYVRKDGQQVLVNLTVTAVMAGDRTPVGYLGVAKDIGKEKAIMSALEEARDGAEAANRAKSDFLANMSHEIRTPMTAVLGMLTLLRNTQLSPLQSRYASDADAAARSMLGLIDDILDLSKAESGNMALELAPFSLLALVAELRALAPALILERDLQACFECDPALPAMVMGDALRVRQVLVNLLGNAIKFTERGKVMVTLACTGERQAGVLFTVQDEGIGIASEQRERIFNAFTQAEASTTRRFGGTGLGLAISARLVQLMGGTLRVDSVPGKGSRFWFSLPLAAVSVPDAAATLAASAGKIVGDRLSAMAVLVVDDQPMNLQVASELLRKEGAEVAVADSGAAALHLLREARFDAVLMDVRMPGMDGYEATRQIRQHPEWSMPIIAMTANVRASDRAACMAAGMSGFLAKPFDLDEMVAVLRGQNLRRASADADVDAAARRRALGRLGGDTDLMGALVRRFPVDAARQLAIIDAAQSGGWSSETSAAAHTLRALAATIGLESLANACKRMEEMASTAEIEEFHRLAWCAIADMASVAPDRTAAASGPVATLGNGEFSQALLELEALLSRSDMRAVDAWQALKVREGAASTDLFAQLEDCMVRLDFRMALAHARSIRKNLS